MMSHIQLTQLSLAQSSQTKTSFYVLELVSIQSIMHRSVHFWHNCPAVMGIFCSNGIHLSITVTVFLPYQCWWRKFLRYAGHTRSAGSWQCPNVSPEQ